MVKSAYRTAQLARAAHPSWSKKRALAMIAYCDESGKPENNPIVNLTALVAYNLRWQRFDADWRRSLAKYKAAIHPIHKVQWFHMKEFDGPCNKPYCDWGKTKKNQLAAALASHTTKTIVFGASHSIHVEEWNEIIVPDIEDPRERKRGWYLFLLQNLMEDIANLVKLPQYERIACVFDENKDCSAIAKEHFSDLKKARGWENIFSSASYDTSCFYPGLQAADMLAYEARRRVEREITPPAVQRPIRKLLLSLESKKQITIAHHGRASLESFKERFHKIKDLLKKGYR